MEGGIAGVVIRLRRAVPPFLRDVIDRAIAAERGPIAWAKEKALVRGEIPPSPWPLTERPVRLLIAPMNYAGQAREWARTAEAPDVEASVLAVRTAASFGTTSYWSVSAEVFTSSRVWRAGLRSALPRFTHVMIESFTSPLGRGTGDVVREDIAWLNENDVRVALVCHGTDVRRPHAHIAAHPFSPFHQLSESALAMAERSAEINVRIAEEFVGPVFVSTPDLLGYVPSARWLPVVVDAQRWASERSVDGAVPVVLHVPSSSAVKGSVHVDRVASTLADTGVIEYRRLEGVEADRMPEQVGSADIVVDQLLLGSYGVAACEALAAGRVVVGNVAADVRAHVLAETGLDVPIVQADPQTLQAVLTRLAADPAERLRLAAQGPEFIARVHSGGMTRTVLADYLAAEG